jgi:predicted nucleotidyltransferase
MSIDPRVQTEIASQPYPLLFATISGAHLYGFPSPDSDYDLRGVHKPLLYVYRVLLTGIRLMRTGEVEANLVKLNEEFNLPRISELIERKLAGAEKSALDGADAEFHQREYERLRGALEDAYQSSSLPEAPAGKPALNDLLVRLRLTTPK